MNSFYNEYELEGLGLKSFGKNVLISRKCSIYGAADMSIGSDVRIDDFCILSGNISIGSYVHISAFAALYGSAGIEIGNFCGVSPRASIFSANDDFSGEFMISPMVSPDLTNVHKAKVKLNDYVQLGANTIVFPGVEFGIGSVIGAASMVSSDIEEWTINVGVPAKKIKARSKHVQDLSKRYTI